MIHRLHRLGLLISVAGSQSSTDLRLRYFWLNVLGCTTVIAIVLSGAVGAAEALESASTTNETQNLDNNRQADDRPISFDLDIQPILGAAGCNTGPCHGKQRGQNGFQLSLLGFDSDFDYNAIVRESRGRRIFPAAAEESLLLQKATAKLPHGGGAKIAPDSQMYQTLVRWISQGAPRRLDGETVLEKVELVTTKFSLAPRQQQPLKVVAHYADGSTRDVTNLATYLSNEATVVDVSESGVLTAGPLPGETAVMARYMNHISVADVVIPQTQPLAEDAFANLPQYNFIDEYLDAKLKQLAILPSEPADEHVFLRRAYTDIIGRLPTAQEAREYLEATESQSSQSHDSTLARRGELIDRLLDRPEYVDHWANQWADLLRPNPYRVGIKAVLNYDNWIRDQFRQGVPYDEFVRRVITARGSTWQNGVATLYRDRRDPEEITTMISQLFLGIRLDCAKCHHHPFEKWSQQDFYQLAGYFSQIGRKGTGLSPPISGGEEIVFFSGSGSVKHPVTGETLQPRTLFGDPGEVEPGQDPRETLARWVTSTENDFFAKVQVNRVWAALMGRGIVEPVDDLRSTNPPTHPELFDALAEHFKSTGYDVKALIRTIALSRAYGVDSTPNESNVGDRINYSRHYRHPLRAETLLDAIADLTDTPTSFSGMPEGSRATHVWTHRVRSMFLDTFGRPDENQDPPCERINESTVTQSLHLMNDRDIDSRIRSDKGRAARLAASDLSAESVVQELYLAAYSRLPTPDETTYAATLINAAGAERRGVIEDLIWAMINSPEFTIQN
jgi:hypothetical protein